MPDLEAGSAAGSVASTAGTLKLLESGRQFDDSELPQLYGYPAELDGVWVRANFIASVDGGATVEGTTGSLGGPGDRFIFNMLRGLADVVVVGAGTVRIEGYSGVHLAVAARQQRQARGQSEVPQLAIVTKSGRLDRELGVFTRTEVPPLVCTCTAVCDETRRMLAGLAEVVDCSGDDPATVDEAALLSALAARGLRRVLTEGGPMLLGSFIERDLLDELCLTIAPFLVGGLPRRITTGPSQVQTPMRCAQILTDDAGYLYTRYVRA
jgi:riboflavin biosynthesis pyrimidine reductase